MLPYFTAFIQMLTALCTVAVTVKQLLPSSRSTDQHRPSRSGFAALGLLAFLAIIFSGVSMYKLFHSKPELEILADDKQELVENKVFINQEVEVDGRKYIRCKFQNVKLVVHGRQNGGMVGNDFYGTLAIQTDDIASAGFGEILGKLGFLKEADQGEGWFDRKEGFTVVRTFPAPPAALSSSPASKAAASN